MKRYRFALISLLLAALCAVAFAQSSQQNPANQAQDNKTQAGKVVSVDAAKGEITIKEDKGGNQTLHVNSDTKITKEGKEITLAEIKVNDRVMYEYGEPGGAVKSLAVVAANKTDK